MAEIVTNQPNNTIYVSSAVTIKGKPFCVVEWGKMKAQLDPDDVRQMALSWLEAAEAAEHDAAVFNELHDGMGLEEQYCAVFISNLRGRRLRRDAQVTATIDKN